jgi:hypothetical protein
MPPKTAQKNKDAQKRKPRSRKVFSFSTDEAELHLIDFKGKIRALRTVPDKKTAKKDYLEHSMFHILHPDISLKPVGVHYVLDEKGKRRWGMVSEVVRPRSADYRIYHDDFYKNHHSAKRPKEVKESLQRHRRFANSAATLAVAETSLRTGITINPHPVNIGNSGGKPVFFEIEDIHPPFLETTIQNTKDPAKRKKLKRLYGSWKKLK